MKKSANRLFTYVRTVGINGKKTEEDITLTYDAVGDNGSDLFPNGYYNTGGKFVMALAASLEDWDAVNAMLEAGEKPHDHRLSDSRYYRVSPLYFALKYGKLGLAEKLYRAGDRLDDLSLREEAVNNFDYALDMLAFYMRQGNNYFIDEQFSLARCVGYCSPDQAMAHLNQKRFSQSDLDEAVSKIITSFRRFSVLWHIAVRELLGQLLRHGANVAQYRDALLLEIFELRSQIQEKRELESLDKIEEIIRNA